MKLQIFQVDAFTSKPFAGNPAAVVPLHAWLPAETMLAIAAENNLAETAFFVPNGDGFDLRWFTPTVEMDLCGHATLASGYVIFELLGTTQKVLRFQTKSGELTVEKDGGRFVLDFPSRPATPSDAPAGLVEAIGKTPKEILKSRDYLFVYESEDEIRSISPDFSALGRVDAHAVIVTAAGVRSDFVSRFFAPAVGLPEDPVTGSAHSTLIPYWAGRLGKNELFARQVSWRGGELYCSLQDERAKIAGDAALYMKGEIYVDAESEKSAAA